MNDLQFLNLPASFYGELRKIAEVAEAVEVSEADPAPKASPKAHAFPYSPPAAVALNPYKPKPGLSPDLQYLVERGEGVRSLLFDPDVGMVPGARRMPIVERLKGTKGSYPYLDYYLKNHPKPVDQLPR